MLNLKKFYEIKRKVSKFFKINKILNKKLKVFIKNVIRGVHRSGHLSSLFHLFGLLTKLCNCFKNQLFF